MRMLAWHCSTVTYSDGRVSTRPYRLHGSEPARQSGSFSDVLLAFITVEASDLPVTADQAGKTVVQMLDQNAAAGGCVIMPFAHLSRDLAEPSVAERLLRVVADGVNALGCSVVLTSFGFHKSLELHMTALGHPGSVAFRQFE